MRRHRFVQGLLERVLESQRFCAHGPLVSTGPMRKGFRKSVKFYRLGILLLHIDDHTAADFAVDDRMSRVDDAVKADFGR